MNKKFLETVKRQSDLAAKAAAGDATKEELAELVKLTAAVKAATDTSDEKPSTALKTMTLAEFKVWHEEAVKAIEEGNSSLLPLVKKNLASVKASGVTDSEGVVAVELPVEKSETDLIADLEARIAALEAAKGEAQAEGSGEENGDEESGEEGDGEAQGDATGKADKPTAQALAMEAIDTLLAKYNKVKAAIEAGSFSKEQAESMYDGDWQLKDAIRQAAAIMAKCGELKAAAEVLVPELEKLSDEGDEGDEGEGEAGGDKNESEKSAGEGWTSGRDMAPTATAAEQLAAIKGRSQKHGY